MPKTEEIGAVSFVDQWVVIHLAKHDLVLPRAQYIAAIDRAKYYKRVEALRRRQAKAGEERAR